MSLKTKIWVKATLWLLGTFRFKPQTNDFMAAGWDQLGAGNHLPDCGLCPLLTYAQATESEKSLVVAAPGASGHTPPGRTKTLMRKRNVPVLREKAPEHHLKGGRSPQARKWGRTASIYHLSELIQARHCLSSSQQPCEGAAIALLILQVRKLKPLAPSYTDSTRKSQCVNPVHLIPEDCIPHKGSCTMPGTYMLSKGWWWWWRWRQY